MKNSQRKRNLDDFEKSADRNVFENQKSNKKIFKQENKNLDKINQKDLSNNNNLNDFNYLIWDANQELNFINLAEKVIWIKNKSNELLENIEYPCSTTETINLNEQYEFVNKEVLKGLFRSKTALDQLSKNDVRRAKSSSNPFEAISKCIFQNRSALKMANLDYVCNYMFTNPSSSILNSNDILYFADLCGGPGGFSEYVLWKKKWEAKGFGLTLKNDIDFNLENFGAASTGTFKAFYGELNDGDIYKPQNLVSFRNYVLCNTEKKGVHFVMGDGAFSVHGREDQQEILSKRIYLCQFVCALSILRTGGHFVCKVFDLFTHFSIGLVYMMFRCFNEMAIIKPNTSRPANSERYIVFKSKLDNSEEVENFLFKVNCSLDMFENSSLESKSIKEDFHDLIPLDLIKQDKEFYDYIYNSNTKIGQRQIHFLNKELAFGLDSKLVDERRDSLRKKCLNLWKIPSFMTICNPNLNPQQKFEFLMNENKINLSDCAYLYYEPKEMKSLDLIDIQYPHNYYFTTLSENRDSDSQRGIFQSYKNNIYFFETSSNTWKTIKIEKLKLPDNTLLYGEITSEFKGEGSGQKKILAFHIIDALILGDLNVNNCGIEERIMKIEKMIKALSINSTSNLIIRVKRYFNLAELENYFSILEMKECKGIRKERVCLPKDNDNFIIAAGILIYNKLKKTWGCCMSKSTEKLYYFNYKSNSESVFDCPKEAINSFITNYTERLFWKWQTNRDLLPPNDDEDNQFNLTLTEQSKLTRKLFIDHITQVLRPK